jgi:hypothetical protein
VPHYHEPLVTHARHQFHQLGGHLPLGVPLAIRSSRRRLRRPVAAQVRRHDPIGLSQPRHDPVPAAVGLREAVQQKHRRAATSLDNEVARIPHSTILMLTCVPTGHIVDGLPTGRSLSDAGSPKRKIQHEIERRP